MQEWYAVVSPSISPPLLRCQYVWLEICLGFQLFIVGIEIHPEYFASIYRQPTYFGFVLSRHEDESFFRTPFLSAWEREIGRKEAAAAAFWSVQPIGCELPCCYVAAWHHRHLISMPCSGSIRVQIMRASCCCRRWIKFRKVHNCILKRWKIKIEDRYYIEFR